MLAGVGRTGREHCSQLIFNDTILGVSGLSVMRVQIIGVVAATLAGLVVGVGAGPFTVRAIASTLS